LLHPAVAISEEAMTAPKLCAAFLGLFLGAALLNAEPPALEPLADVSPETKTEIKVALKAKDGADKPLRFAIAKVRQDGKEVPAPRGMTIHAESGAFAWTPTPSQAGRYEITFAVKDAKDQESTGTLKITVKERPISAMNNEVGKLLLKWHAEGTAAGNTGDFYDNRDGEHSPLGLDPWPQLDKVQYTEDQFKRRVNWAAAHTILKHVTFGNSSTSAGVLQGGSNPRHYHGHPRGLPFLYDMYRANNVYIYPGHHDHHPGHNGKPQFYGDVYFTNSPYLYISQGSSGSDQPFMRAIPSTLAAFRPAVKKKLIETGLLMPTIQMLLRSTNKHLKDPKEYLTGKAHPTVFEGSWGNDLAMVQAAHAITADTIPPMVQLKVVDEDAPVPGRDFFEGGGEKLPDTPCVISRIVRGPNYVRRLVVSAEGSFDVNKKPLTFHWSVLRGDSQRITIKPLNDNASVVEIKVPYHDRYTIDSPVKIETNRVDIGAFVNNGTYYSAPGFVTLYTLDNEARTYDTNGRLLEIGYGVGDADLSVTDWNGLFAVFQGESKDFPSQLLHRQFKDAERTELAKAGQEYKMATEKQTAAQAVSKKAAETRNQAQAALKAADDKLKAAKKAFEDDGGDASFDLLKKAIQEQETAETARKTAEAEFQTAQKATDAANKTVNDILTQKRAGLDAPVRTLVDAALNRVRDDPKFYLDNRLALEALPVEQSRKDRLATWRKRLIELGIFQPDKDGVVLHSVRTGTAPVAERLTAYERNSLARFHADVLSALVYPKLLAVNFQVNFVDQRLTTPKFWRDIYRYDAHGNRLGWLRRDGESETEFNADGCVILEKDALGRTVKARNVKYELDPAALKSNVRVLKPVLGDKLLAYEYTGDDDFKGKVTKEETIVEKQ
jgi:hypothetical protein